MDKNIITECYVDTCLIETLVATTTGYNHQKGCNNVAKTMQELKIKGSFALGVVDKDKRQLKYLEEFSEVKSYNNALFLHKHKSKPHYIIQIYPAAETFIIESAQTCGIMLDRYNLPTTIKALTDETKNIKSKKDERFRKLFKDLKEQNAENICKLAQWVEHFKANPYAINLALL